MKKKLLLTFTFLAASLILVQTYVFTYQRSPVPAVTGAPGETTCNTAGCHIGNPVNSPGGSISIKLVDGSTEVNTYEAGKTYTVQVEVQKGDAVEYGFELTALGNDQAKIGTLSTPDIQLVNVTNSLVQSKQRQYARHSNSQMSTTKGVFNVRWTAPAYLVPVTFYAAGNAANNNNHSQGDYIYNDSLHVNGVVGIDDNAVSTATNIAIYPNPVSEYINLYFSLEERSQVNIALLSLDGKTVKATPSEWKEVGAQTVVVNVTSLPRGLYILRLQVNGESFAQKIFKQ
ncbi:MAG: T9SS type A sorting domain-containing protein [Bacteroidota bacterium]|nr:T9SS type A sorting domain-containing protein [Bacteroidota bacterium]